MAERDEAVAVRAATTADKPVIANLIQLYMYDMIGDAPFPIGRDGTYPYELLDRFWQHPYLIFRGDALAGFALVVDGSPLTNAPDRHFMAEFFVLRPCRRGGVGMAAFAQILRRHAGAWQVGVLDRNVAANAFWAKAIGPYAPRTFRHRFFDEDWLVYEFSPGA